MLKNKITIYTDGAAKGNPGQAGWGAVILFYPYLAFGSRPKRAPYSRGRSKEGVLELGGHVDHATNNQMELTAPIEALKYLKKYPYPTSPYSRGRSKEGVSIEVISDSKYVILGITEWVFNWQKNNWRNAAKKPVLNKELWQELFALTEKLKPKWSYVEGHAGHKHNERADEIATSFAEGEPVKLKK
jgi:ribonuclease HI